MNTHILRIKKAFVMTLAVVSCSFLLQAQTVQAQQERHIPESAQKYNNTGGGGGDSNTPLKTDPKSEIFLLQPLDDSTHRLNAAPGIQIFFQYFNLSWPWILGVCAGFAVLQAMVGGMQIMLSAGGSGKESGKERMMWATAGLLIIALAGMILSTINPIFYA